jgi:hypothetical protein
MSTRCNCAKGGAMNFNAFHCYLRNISEVSLAQSIEKMLLNIRAVARLLQLLPFACFEALPFVSQLLLCPWEELCIVTLWVLIVKHV